MNTKPPRPQPVGGLVLFRQGFRPFFFAAGFWGVISVALWLAVVNGAASVSTTFGPAAWHTHEMIFGFTGAVIAGFLLTAIPNWTGRLPLQGLPLLILFVMWLVGRVVMAIPIHMPSSLVAVLDLSFLTALLLVVLREILSGRNWRNVPMPIALGGLLLANVLTHLEAAGQTQIGLIGQRLGIATIVMLISLVGGRIIPSFTRNWLAKRADTHMPAGFGRFDRICLILTLVALGAWVANSDSRLTGVALLVAGLASVVRLCRWRGHRTVSEPLVWGLHLGFAWVPVGLCLLGLGVLMPEFFPQTVGLHALTVGAIASMTLAVMTRAILGHTGRPLTADRWTTAIYILIAAAAAARVAAPIALDGYDPLLWASGLLWSAAFGLFTVHYGRMLLAQ
ncbi:MAG: NnrS family protein [Alphaproteobacteria bacterium]|nr:NnrS family protein [Alphaproteobacteria bacterium]